MQENRHSRRREEFDGDDDQYDKQRDRKERRASERAARKRARIESHERWVEQRRELKRKTRLEKEQLSQRNGTLRTPKGQTRKLNNQMDTLQRQKLENTSVKRSQLNPKSPSHPLREVINVKAKRAVNGKPHNATVMAAKKEDKMERKEKRVMQPKTDAKENASAKYVPPVLWRKMEQNAHTTLHETTRRVVNKLTVGNVAELTREVSALFDGSSIGGTRAEVVQSLSHNLNRMCMLDTGPLTAIVALPFAGLIRGLQLLHGNIVGSELIENLCITLQEHLISAQETAASNGAMTLAYLYLLNAVDATMIVSFLRSTLSHGSAGEDTAVCAAACCLALLRACGEKLLKEAPQQMEQALAETKSYSTTRQIGGRYAALLSYITEIVSGHTRRARRTAKEEEIPVDALLGDLSTLLPGYAASGSNKRVLLRVVRTTSVLSGLSWEKIICPSKPSRWYNPSAWDDAEQSMRDECVKTSRSTNNYSANDHTSEGVDSCNSGDTDSSDGDSDRESEDDVNVKSDAESESTSGADDEAYLRAERVRRMRQQEKAISGQRLNTENKREIFQCIAEASDDLECFNLLMHRDPTLDRLHDTFSVLIQCCYQEKMYNPYYGQVLQRFCSVKSSCKNTLQFAIWDLFKSIRVETVDVTGYFNLSCLISGFMEVGVYTLGVLRGLDLENTNKTIGLFTRILLLRLILQLSPTKLTEIFFGGDGFYAHDVKIDTSLLRSNLAKVVERYFIDESEANKWIPLFYNVIAAGTSFASPNITSQDDEARLQSFLKRIRVVAKALKGGIS